MLWRIWSEICGGGSGSGGASHPTRPPPATDTHKADEVGAPGVPQQVGGEALQGDSSGSSRGDDHVL